MLTILNTHVRPQNVKDLTTQHHMITKDHFYQDLLHARFLLHKARLFNIVMMAFHLKIVHVDTCMWKNSYVVSSMFARSS